jgi:hypothetical protein
MTRGAHFGYNAGAYGKAVEDVRAFLRRAFKMP